MTLGCGGYGGNITSDNISPRHLLNIKRLAYETTPAGRRCAAVGRRRAGCAAEGRRLRRADRPGRRRSVAGACGSTSSWRRADTRRRAPSDPAAGARSRAAPPAATAAGPAPAPPAVAGADAGAAGREADRLRVRRRRAAGHAAGAQDCDRRADDRHAGGARPRRGAPGLRPGWLAALTMLLPAELDWS